MKGVNNVHFLSPAYLWLAFYLLPTIIFLYLMKRTYQDMTISSTWLWKQTLREMEARKPWQKFRYHLLLMLQLLAALFFIVGLSQPAFPIQGLTAKHSILVIDISGSMWTQEEGKTRMEMAKEKVLEWIDHKSEQQMVTLITMGKVPKIVASKSKDRTGLKRTIKQLQAGMSAADFRTTMSLANAISVNDPSSEVIVISDGAVQTATSTHLPHRFVQVGKTSENVAIGAVSSEQEGHQQRLFVRVDNWGKKKNQITVSVRNKENRLLQTQSMHIASGKSEVIHFESLPPSDYYHIQLRSDRDALLLDNQQYYFSNQKNAVTMQWMGDRNLFLQKALALHPHFTWEQSQQSSQKLSPFTIVNNHPQPLPQTGPLFVIRPHQAQKLVTVTGTTSVSGTVQIDQHHPIVHRLPLKELAISEVVQVKVPTWAEPVLKINETPILLAGEYQGRKVVIFLFDLQHSDLVLQPSFPILVAQTINWLYPVLGMKESQATVGDPIDFNLSPHIQKVVIVNKDQQWIQSVQKGMFRWQVPEQIGLYRIVDAQTQEDIGYLSVPFPREESDVTPQAMATSAQKPPTATFSSQQEWWWWFALCTGLIISLEWVVVTRGD